MQIDKAKIDACVFDFDGVIVDSEPLHELAQQAAFDFYGINYEPGIFSKYRGIRDAVLYQYGLDRTPASGVTLEQLDILKKEKFHELFENVKYIPGSLNFLRKARSQYGKIGLVTSSARKWVVAEVNKSGIYDLFDFIVTGDDTEKHKPAPEPYLHMLNALKVRGEETIVIEDSQSGILSAKAAGCIAIGLTTSFSGKELASSGADFVCDSFPELAEMLF